MVICRPSETVPTKTIPADIVPNKTVPSSSRSTGPVLLPRPRPSSWAVALLEKATSGTAEVQPPRLRPVLAAV